MFHNCSTIFGVFCTQKGCARRAGRVCVRSQLSCAPPQNNEFTQLRKRESTKGGLCAHLHGLAYGPEYRLALRGETMRARIARKTHRARIAYMLAFGNTQCSQCEKVCVLAFGGKAHARICGCGRAFQELILIPRDWHAAFSAAAFPGLPEM